MSRPDFPLGTPVLRRFTTPAWPPLLVADPASGGPVVDTWRYFVPPLGRERAPAPNADVFASAQPTVFQPLHRLFAAVLVDGADVPGVEVRAVIRRGRRALTKDDLTPEMRDFATEIPGTDAARIGDVNLADLLSLEDFIPDDLTARYESLMAEFARERQGRVAGAWAGLGEGTAEDESPMWRLPGTVRWFGAVPTDAPYLGYADPIESDYRWAYRMVCVARWEPPPDKPYCPPGRWVSPPSAPFRIAPFTLPPATAG